MKTVNERNIANLYMRALLCREVYSICESLNKIEYSIIKGEPLSFLAYGKFGQRSYSDVDFLISRNDFEYLKRILNNKGFYQSNTSRQAHILYLSASHQVDTFVKKIGNIRLLADVNFDIFWGEYTGKRIDMKNFLSNAIDMNIYGYNVKTLSPLEAFVQLILHHYKEMNSIYCLAVNNGFDTQMFKDVYYLLKNHANEISIDKLLALSKEYGINKYVYYILYFTYQIFKDELLVKYIDIFKTDEGDALLDYYGLSEKERKPWNRDIKTRLEANNKFDLIKNDLTGDDIEKIERNVRLFG